ncbi:MAG TPA: hypothetical protein VFP05_02245 [Thermomicrobiales bacterium]|nr:hypothetical protein [Thermomicrobiales bacterium]
MNTLDLFGTEYLRIAFGIERHFPGFIDAYVGPAELRAEADMTPAPAVAELLQRNRGLHEQLPAQGYPETRQDYLDKQLTGIAMVLRKLQGEDVPYRDEVAACFDIEIEMEPEATFEAAIAELEEIVPGRGPLFDRMNVWRDRYVIDNATARAGFDLLLNETRNRTLDFVELPAGESIELSFVVDKPWSGYNWYLGNAKSLVEINVDLPIRANAITDLIAHEGYPGHHTEHSLKDRELYQGKGYAEHAIHLINTPECVISEGIATAAEAQIFPGDEGIVFKSEVLYPALGVQGDPEREERIDELFGKLRAVAGNAAILRHEQDASESEVIDYLMRWELTPKDRAERRFRFIDDPLWRPYIFTYFAGRDLVLEFLGNGPRSEQIERFRHTLTQQITPSWLRTHRASAIQA